MNHVSRLKLLGEACRKNAGNVIPLLRQDLLGDSCLLLECARELRQTDEFASDELRETLNAIKQAFALKFCAGVEANKTPLAARLMLIEAAIGNPSKDELPVLVEAAIDIYRDIQGDGRWHEIAADVNKQRRPSWCERLPNEGLRDVFHGIAVSSNHGGWRDPALCFAGETVARIWNDADPRVLNDHDRPPVKTSILFAGQGRGLIGEFTVYRVPGGDGYLYPDPASNSYFAASDSFAQSLRNAWYAAHPHVFPQLKPFDICWSLKVKRPEDNLRDYPQLSGRSGEVAIYCALRGLCAGEPLDSGAAVSAKLAQPLTSEQRLTSVTQIETKLKTANFADEAERTQIVNLVLYADKQRDKKHGQDPPDAEIQAAGFKGEIHRVQYLEAAYHRVSQFGVMTHTAKKKLAEVARQTLLERCNANTPSHYVRSPLWFEKDRERDESHPTDRIEKSLERLSAEDCEKIASAADDAKLVAFFADSGIGKTTFLEHCRERVASEDHGCVPILLDHLDVKPWDNPKVFYDSLTTWFKSYLPADYQEPTIRQWLVRLRDAGKLVFLLDAIDQTEDELTIPRIRSWIAGAGGVQNCTIYVTGRPWTQQSRLFDAWEAGRTWRRLHVGLLDRPQVAEFVGEELADTLREVFPDSEDDEDPQQSSSDDVLRVPMVLKLLKDLGTRLGVKELGSRERIYHAALESRWNSGTQQGGAIGKGIATLAESRYRNPDLGNNQVVCNLLGQVAWSMLESGQFQGHAKGANYEELDQLVRSHAMSKHWDKKSELLDSLGQVGMFEHGQEYLQWRHLSLCEYFAGRHLAEHIAADADTLQQKLGEILDMVKSRERARRAHQRGRGDTRSPHDRWQWVFRFAISRLYHAWQASKDDETTAAKFELLIGQLMAYGAVYVVHDAIRFDKVNIDDTELGRLCRWLVHWDHHWGVSGGNRRNVWQENEPPPALDRKACEILDTLFDRRYRFGPVLPAAWHLVERAAADDSDADQATKTRATNMRNRFLDASNLAEEELAALRTFLDSFCLCPPQEFDFLAAGGNARPAGEGTFVFAMGSPEDEAKRDEDERQHDVRLRAFSLSAFCVTNNLFETMVPSHFFDRNQRSRDDDQPVLYVNWWMADLFSRVWLNGVLTAVVADMNRGETFHLPSEAQWEFACRAGSSTRFWWGEDYEADHCNTEDSLGRTIGVSETLESGVAYRNAFGLYHMAGNNWEWCHDRYGDYEETPVVDPVGPRGRANRVDRGGGWGNNARYCRSAYRSRYWPESRDNDLGFRVARSLSGKTSENSQEAEPDT